MFISLQRVYRNDLFLVTSIDRVIDRVSQILHFVILSENRFYD